MHEELRHLQGQLKEMAALEAEEARLRGLLKSEGFGADDEIAAEVAEHLGSVPALPVRGVARRPPPGLRAAESASPRSEPAAGARPTVHRSGPTFHGFHQPATEDVSAAGADLALEFIDLRDVLPQLMDLRESPPATVPPQTRATGDRPRHRGRAGPGAQFPPPT